MCVFSSESEAEKEKKKLEKTPTNKRTKKGRENIIDKYFLYAPPLVNREKLDYAFQITLGP